MKMALPFERSHERSPTRSFLNNQQPMRTPKTFEMNIQVSPEDLDENEHVNNVQYLQWVQEVAKRHWEIEAKSEWLENYVWVAASHHIEYKKPAFLNEMLSIKTHVDSFNGVKSNRLVRIYHQDSDQLLCQCSTVWVMLDRKTNKPMRCPKEMEDHFFTISE